MEATASQETVPVSVHELKRLIGLAFPANAYASGFWHRKFGLEPDTLDLENPVFKAGFEAKESQ